MGATPETPRSTNPFNYFLVRRLMNHTKDGYANILHFFLAKQSPKNRFQFCTQNPRLCIVFNPYFGLVAIHSLGALAHGFFFKFQIQMKNTARKNFFVNRTAFSCKVEAKLQDQLNKNSNMSPPRRTMRYREHTNTVEWAGYGVERSETEWMESGQAKRRILSLSLSRALRFVYFSNSIYR